MIDYALLAIFIPTFFFVSITPGMCMTLAMTLGMTIGVRKTLNMMWGELLGVAVVAIAAAVGVAAIITKYPELFIVLKVLGATYLAYVAFGMWNSTGKMALTEVNGEPSHIKKRTLFAQGFFTAVANPKGWAFMISLLPPFISKEHDLAPQLLFLITVILCSELICMLIYATGGKTIGRLITNADNVKRVNRLSGALMFGVALWLVLS